MNRESALLGTPTYTVFAGELAAVDQRLIREGRLHDLREQETNVSFVKKQPALAASAVRGATIQDIVLTTIESVAGRR
jgi:predicted glycosyltransferase